MFVLIGCKQSDQAEEEPSRDQGQGEVLAKIDGESITAEEFLYWWERHPPAEDTPEARAELLEALIERKVMVRKAREAGMETDIGVRMAYDSLLISRYRERHLNDEIASIQVNEEEARDYYEQLAEKESAKPEKLQVAVLWLNSRGQPQLEERYRNRLEEARLKLLHDETLKGDPAAGFGNLAIRYSDHQATRFQGGRQGWMEGLHSSDDWKNEVLSIARELEEPGAISSVKVTPEGVFLVRMVERKSSKGLDFAVVKTHLQSQLMKERRAKTEKEFRDTAFEGRVISRDQDALKNLDLTSR